MAQRNQAILLCELKYIISFLQEYNNRSSELEHKYVQGRTTREECDEVP